VSPNRPAAVVVAVLLTVLPASAQQALTFTAGEISLARSAFTDATSFARTSLGGSIEMGFGGNLGVQADLNGLAYNFVDQTVTNTVLHGIYHLSPDTAAGMFIGSDRVSGSSAEFVGFEASHATERLEAEGYVLVRQSSGESYSLLGLSGRYGVTPALWLGLSLDTGDVQTVDGTRISLDADVRLAQNITLFSSFGQLDGDVLGTPGGRETYFEVGARISFGANSGTTFGRRSLFNQLPGL
jgi:hypothetical protein